MNYGHNAINPHAQDQFALSNKQEDTYGGLRRPEPISLMGGATAELQMSFEVLAKVADELRSRLFPVLRPGGPDGCEEKSAPRDMSSPMRDQLGLCTLRVGSIRDTLNDILDRLEV